MSFLSKMLILSTNIFGSPYGEIVFFLFPTMLLSIPGWLISYRNHGFYWWDLGFFVYGMIFWMIFLVVFQSKGDSLANLFIEPFIVSILSLLVFYVRIFFASHYIGNQKLLSFLSIGILFVLILILRLFIPALPE